MTRPVFKNYGGIDQLQIETIDDLERIGTLDRARWAATSVPCEQLFCDPVLLKYMDTDDNQRLRADELCDAIRWLFERVSDRSDILKGTDELVLSSLNKNNSNSQRLKLLAEQVLKQLGRSDKSRIHLADVRESQKTYAKHFPNGDGVVPISHLADPTVAQFATEVLKVTGGARDVGGELGVRSEDVDTFLTEAKAFIEWYDRGNGASDLFPLGKETASALALVVNLEPKMSQFFAQCALLSLDPATATCFQITPEELARLDIHTPAAIDSWLDSAPLARPNAEALLPLTTGVNPRYAATLRILGDSIIPRLRNDPEIKVEALSASDWAQVQTSIDAFRQWQESRSKLIPADANADALSKLMVNGPIEALRAFISEDRSVAEEMAEFNDLERLLLYQRWILEVANNFVSFPALFVQSSRTLFEMGTLILDGRRLSLCMRVNDREGHKLIADTSLMFLVYAEIVRKEGGVEEKDLIAAAVTAGTRGGISVGKRGVFYDRNQHEWDAIIVDISVQPISIWEATLAPFLRLRDGIASRFSSTIASKAEAAETQSSSLTHGVPDKSEASPVTTETQTPAASGSSLQTLLVGGGVAFAAIGTSLAFVVKTVSDIDPWSAILTLGSMAIFMAFLFAFLGWLRLRRRDVSALLEACGWALNGRMWLTRELSVIFTVRPPLPPRSIRHVQIRSRRPGLYLLILFIVVSVSAVLFFLQNQ